MIDQIISQSSAGNDLNQMIFFTKKNHLI